MTKVSDYCLVIIYIFSHFSIQLAKQASVFPFIVIIKLVVCSPFAITYIKHLQLRNLHEVHASKRKATAILCEIQLLKISETKYEHAHLHAQSKSTNCPFRLSQIHTQKHFKSVIKGKSCTLKLGYKWVYPLIVLNKHVNSPIFKRKQKAQACSKGLMVRSTTRIPVPRQICRISKSPKKIIKK